MLTVILSPDAKSWDPQGGDEPRAGRHFHGQGRAEKLRVDGGLAWASTEKTRGKKVPRFKCTPGTLEKTPKVTHEQLKPPLMGLGSQGTG